MKIFRPSRSLTLALCSALALPAQGAEITSSIDATALPTYKTTLDGKYLSSQDVYHMVWEEPAILFIDVRDPVELAQIGHPEKVDANIPIRIQDFDSRAFPQLGQLSLNPGFLDDMKETLLLNNKSRHDLIILTCGSGRRSAEAARILSDNGYTNVWHVPDGYDGDHTVGYNLSNAWKDAGLPWSMELAQSSPWPLKVSY